MTKFLVLQNKFILKELGGYLSVLFDLRNPITISLFLFIILSILLSLAMRNSIIPKQNKLLHEKSEIEAHNTHLMAIFAELDPDPIVRINNSGEIIFTNHAAKKSGFSELVGEPIQIIISTLNINPEDFIKNNEELTFNLYFCDKYYSVYVKGIRLIKIAQIYLHDITDLKTNEERLKDSQKELKDFSKYLQLKVEEERKRIARELHDDIGQKMMLLKLTMLRDVNNLTNSKDSVELQTISRLIEGITSDIKTIAHSLIPSTLEEIGLHASLINLIDNIKLRSSIIGNLEFTNVNQRLNINFEISIYRIVQEALNNIIRYSKANEFNIELTQKDDKLRLLIADEGIGFDIKSNKKGMGIRNMKERAEMHKGTFKIISSPNEGTIILINFPIGE